MPDDSQYPSADQIETPELDEVSPDQEHYVSWLAQHNRLWWAFLLSVALNALLGGGLFLLSKNYEPTRTYVTFKAGFPVTWNQQGQAVVDSVKYVPERLRAVVETFITNRYEYDWQNPEKINTALRYMSPEARRAERKKLRKVDVQSTVIQPQMKADLNLNWTAMEVVAQGDGVFQVSVPAEVAINDAIRHPDPDNPFVKNATIELTVETVPASDTNPLGYRIISTGNGIL